MSIDKYLPKLAENQASAKKILKPESDRQLAKTTKLAGFSQRAGGSAGRETKIRLLKEDERPVKSLTNSQIKKLLSASKPYKTLRMKILLALGRGLRLGDIETCRVSDIDFENSSVTTRSKKTRKSMGSRHVPVPVMAELKKYVSGLGPEQERIFNRRFNQDRWEKISYKVGLPDLKFHDLRKTFGSVLAQNGISTAVTQKLLEHSSSDLNNKVYTNVDPVLRHAIDQIPASDWLQVTGCKALAITQVKRKIGGS